MRIPATILLLVTVLFAEAQEPFQRFTMYGDVHITIDVAADQDTKNQSLIILYALPNGNTTEQTMG